MAKASTFAIGPERLTVVSVDAGFELRRADGTVHSTHETEQESTHAAVRLSNQLAEQCAVKSLLSMFADWCEPVMVACCRCDCKTPRDDSPRLQDVFGSMSLACQECADVAESEELHEHDCDDTTHWCQHAACRRLRAETERHRRVVGLRLAPREQDWINEDGRS